MIVWVLSAFLAAGVCERLPSGCHSTSQAQEPAVQVDGRIALMFDVLPRRDAVEHRPEVRVEAITRPGPGGMRAGADVIAQALVADRDGRVTDALVDVRDAWLETAGERAEIRAGYGRVIWGRLDEVQPSDVINPIDATKFLLDGRTNARRAVPFIRGRLFASDALRVEGVVVPAFRRATFDELDEQSSPFNLVADAIPPTAPISREVRRVPPRSSFGNVSGGARVSGTVGRVDVAAAIYRGFETFGVIQLEPAPAAPAGVELVERFPRFTMVAGDFEAVIGEWALRGESAFFTERSFASRSRPGTVKGRTVEAGAGFDRRAGEFRVFGTVLLRRDWSSEDPLLAATNVSLVASIERQFAREKYAARVFAVVNPGDASSFVRGLFTWSVRDNVSVDASAAAFSGTGDDTVSRFAGRDFVFTRLRVHF